MQSNKFFLKEIVHLQLIHLWGTFITSFNNIIKYYSDFYITFNVSDVMPATIFVIIFSITRLVY